MLCEEVRRYCEGVAQAAERVRVDAGAASYTDGVAGLDPEVHFLDAHPDEVARYVLVLDTINFGSGWFDELRVDTNVLSVRLSGHARALGRTWTAKELRAGPDVGDVLGIPHEHELTQLYVAALQQLGAWLDRHWIHTPSVARLAKQLAQMPFFDDRGFYKRAQITVNDLQLAGVATYHDIDRLTAFADNLVPHVLRVDGVLTYAPELGERIDAGQEIERGSQDEIEIRACAVHACELLSERAGVPPRVLDNWLWNRGLEPRYKRGPMRPHKTKTVFY